MKQIKTDYTVFVSNWLKQLYIEQGIGEKEKHVIYAGANENIFNSEGLTTWDKKSKVKNCNSSLGCKLE